MSFLFVLLFMFQFLLQKIKFINKINLMFFFNKIYTISKFLT